MICTEQEAKTKWCPQRLTVISWGPDELPATASRGNCIGSACMLWVWVDQQPDTKQLLGTCGLIQRGTP